MTKRRKLLLWCGLVLSGLATFYAAMSFVTYAWFEASGHRPIERAAQWAYSALAMAGGFFALFVYCLVSLIKDINHANQNEQNAT
jgi:hypothetical protein